MSGDTTPTRKPVPITTADLRYFASVLDALATWLEATASEEDR
jgi:hypothetical protein